MSAALPVILLGAGGHAAVLADALQAAGATVLGHAAPQPGDTNEIRSLRPVHEPRTQFEAPFGRANNATGQSPHKVALDNRTPHRPRRWHAAVDPVAAHRIGDPGPFGAEADIWLLEYLHAMMRHNLDAMDEI